MNFQLNLLLQNLSREDRFLLLFCSRLSEQLLRHISETDFSPLIVDFTQTQNSVKINCRYRLMITTTEHTKT